MRNKRIVKISDPESRDNGKTFILTEMDSYSAELWASRVLDLLSKVRGAPAPADGGTAELASKGLSHADIASFLALHDPSLESMWDCVQYQHNPKHDPQPLILKGPQCQIDEIGTWAKLRVEFLDLTMGFSQAAVPSNLAPQARSAA